MIGQTLSHYRITAALGAGGMGEVYRATDENLGRDVAIKVLPPEVAQDPDRLGRFRREAHLLAALNHPNIAAIYGLEESDGKPFLALELVLGEDLKQRLARGAIPVDEALEIARQIAEALEEAHNKGIVHRDLKPANVKLTPDGKVKVLDFGLAKAWAGNASGVSSGSALSQSPTMAKTGTVAGVILGTAAYMSPEQARGKPVDKRADVWSFGVLLREMLTGRALFSGETVTDVITQVMTREPELDALPAQTPAAVRRLIARCLRKDPRQRLPDIGAARLELQEVIAGTPSADAVAGHSVSGPTARRRPGVRVAWAALALALAVGGMAVGRFTATPAVRIDAPVAHFAFQAPSNEALIGEPPALSPDGRTLAFVAAESFRSLRIHTRALDSLETRPLAGTDGALELFWSGDGASIGFITFSGGTHEVRRVSPANGAVQKVCALPRPGHAGATWNASGTIVLAAGGFSAGLYTVAAAGGEPKPLLAPDAARGEIGYSHPHFLGDGRHFVFTVGATSTEVSGVYVASLDEPGRKRRVLDRVARAQWVPGYLLASHAGVVTAQRFDSRLLSVIGDPIPIASSVFTQYQRIGSYSASANGILIWRHDNVQASRLEWRARDGRVLGTIGDVEPYRQVSLSPDGARIAAEVSIQGRTEVWILDVARAIGRRAAGGNLFGPLWSPDSQELIYADVDGGLLRNALSAEAPKTLPVARDFALAFPEQWAPDGRLFYLAITTQGESHFALSPTGDMQRRKVFRAGITQPQVSPDGRWLAYGSWETGLPEVYLEPFGRDGEKLRVSPGNGGQPLWRADGKELFYLSPAGLMAVDVRATEQAIALGVPSMLVRFERDVVFDIWSYLTGLRDYAVTADGQRFLFKVVDSRTRPQLHVLVNWPSLLAP